MLKKGLIVSLLLAANVALAAPTRYISDELEITLRSGPTTQHRITQMLSSGTAVEVLETTDDGWARVRVAGGREGWVLNRYLMNNPSARSQLEQAQRVAVNAKDSNEELRTTLADEQQRATELADQLRQVQTQNQRMQQQLTEASEGLALAGENKELKKRIVDLQREIQDLVNETERLGDRSRQDWFMVGAGVLFGGMILGLILPRLRWRKRSTWSSGL